MGSLALKTDYKIICRFGSDPFYIMTGRQNKELLAEVNEALGQIAEAGASFQTDLYQKYYGEKEAEGEVVFTREEAEYIPRVRCDYGGVYCFKSTVVLPERGRKYRRYYS